MFEFLSDSTAAHDRGTKLRQYLIDIGVQEYFIHQPEGDKPPEFRGWRRSTAGEIEGIVPEADGGLFSRSLNLWLRWENYIGNVRLLRPYLPDGTPITTSAEEVQLREEAEVRAQQAETLVQQETQRRQQVELELAQLRAQLAALEDKDS